MSTESTTGSRICDAFLGIFSLIFGLLLAAPFFLILAAPFVGPVG